MAEDIRIAIAFGPVPSRRLGKSLGVNNIPPKICTYSCVYCQLGRSLKMTAVRQRFYEPEKIFEQVREKVIEVKSKGEEIDYITFVPDGEPTIDVNLGKEASLLKELGIPLAIITNSSLIWDEGVQEDLMNFDLVSVKVDAVSKEIWRKVNRPIKFLDLDKILENIRIFSMKFNGILFSETMLIDNIDYGNEFEKIAAYLSSLENLKCAYISVPTRPPAEDWARPPGEELLNEAFQIFKNFLGNKVELLIGYEGDAFAYSGDIEKDILSITAVHPMREESIKRLVEREGEEFSKVENLLRRGLIKKVYYQGHVYYIRNLKNLLP
ncbi:MAG: radical SAM protein [bacterium]|nr:radical SAM protein [bacterium]